MKKTLIFQVGTVCVQVEDNQDVPNQKLVLAAADLMGAAMTEIEKRSKVDEQAERLADRLTLVGPGAKA